MDFPFIKEAISQLFSKPSCEMYLPDKTKLGAPNYRGRIVFHPDKCINCMMCERVCSGNAITHTVEKTEEGDKVTRTFYLGSCTFCATCMDFCTHGAIEFTRDYHMIATKEEDLMVSGTFLKKPPVKKPAPPKPAQAPAAPKADPDATIVAAPKAAPAAGSVIKPPGRRQARSGALQVRLLHHLRQEMPRRGADGGSRRQDLDPGRGQLRGLRHLRGGLPQEGHPHAR